MSNLEQNLWSNIVELPHKTKRSMTRPFVFTMGLLTGAVLQGLAAYLIH